MLSDSVYISIFSILLNFTKRKKNLHSLITTHGVKNVKNISKTS